MCKNHKGWNKGDHTVLMNRDRGISANLHFHLISPSAHTLPLSFHVPLFLCLLGFLSNFVAFSLFPFGLLAHASLISCNKFLDCLVDASSFCPALPSLFSDASALLGSCVLVGRAGALARRRGSLSLPILLPASFLAP